MRAVVSKVNAAVRLPAQAIEGRQLSILAVDHRVIPVEDVDLQSPASVGQRVQEVSEPELPWAGFEREASATVEVPCQDQDRALRALGGPHEGVEVGRAIDEQREPLGRRHSTAVSADLEKTGLGKGIGHDAPHVTPSGRP
jgi:hypothetical protein